jgi:hypothetical protein
VNKNRLLIAVIVFVGLGGAAAAAMRSKEAETTLEKPSASLTAIKQDQVTSLEIQNPKKGNVTLSKQDGKWKVTAPVQASADQSAVESMLDKLSELEVTGVAASRKENHARLEVDPAQAIRVIAKQADKPLLDLYLGASKSSGTMVRSEGQDAVLRLKGSMRYAFDKELKMIRDRVILDIESKDLTAVSISSPKGTFKFEKTTPEAKWTQVLAKGEKPIQRFSDAKVTSLTSTLARLRAADFAAPEDTAETTGLDKPQATAVLTKADGSTSTLELGKEVGGNQEYFLRLSGNEQVFRVSKYNAERLMADASSFQEAEKKEGASAEAPPAMPDMGGGQQIPPEVLRQLQQQLGAQGMGGGSPH